MRQNFNKLRFHLLIFVLMGCQGKPIDERSEPKPGVIDQKPEVVPDFLEKGLLGSSRGIIFDEAESISQSQVVNSAISMPDDSILVSISTANYELSGKVAHFVKKILPDGTFDSKFSIEIEGNGQYLAVSNDRLFVATNHFESQCIINRYDLNGKLLDEQMTVFEKDCETNYRILDIKYHNGFLYILTFRRGEYNPLTSDIDNYYEMTITDPKTGIPMSGWPRPLGTKQNRFEIMPDGGIVAYSTFSNVNDIIHFSPEGVRKVFFTLPATINGIKTLAIDKDGNHFVAAESETGLRVHKVAPGTIPTFTTFPYKLSDFVQTISVRISPRVGGDIALVVRKIPTGNPSDLTNYGGVAAFVQYTAQGSLRKMVDLTKNFGLPDYLVSLKDNKLAAVGTLTSNRAKGDFDIYRLAFLGDGSADALTSIDLKGPGNDSIMDMVPMTNGDLLVSGTKETKDGDHWWLAVINEKSKKPFIFDGVASSGSGVPPLLSQGPGESIWIAQKTAGEIKIVSTVSPDILHLPIGNEDLVQFKSDSDSNLVFLSERKDANSQRLEYKLKVMDSKKNKYSFAPVELQKDLSLDIGIAVDSKKIYTSYGDSNGKSVSLQKYTLSGAKEWDKSFQLNCQANVVVVDDVIKKDNGVIAIGHFRPVFTSALSESIGWWAIGVDDNGVETTGWNICESAHGNSDQKVAGVWTDKRFYISMVSDQYFDEPKNQTKIFSFNHIARPQTDETISLKSNSRYVEASRLIEKDGLLSFGGLTTSSTQKIKGSKDCILLQFDLDD